jgi:hypothetical protein
VRVFVSYSHDSEEHRAAVLDLAQRLRGAGLDAVLDRYVVAPPEGWPRWMLAQVEQAKFVLAVCTPTYRRRFDGKERRGDGLGATYEGLLSLQTIHDEGSNNRKFIPILLPGAVATRSIPLTLRSFTRYRFPMQFDALVDHLLGRAGVHPAPIGELPPEPLRSEGHIGTPAPKSSAANVPKKARVTRTQPSLDAKHGGVTITGKAQVIVGGHIVGGDLIIGPDAPRPRRKQ